VNYSHFHIFGREEAEISATKKGYGKKNSTTHFHTLKHNEEKRMK